LGELAHQGEADAGALGGAGRLQPIEELEDALALAAGDAGAVVAHTDAQRAGRVFGTADVDLPALRIGAELDGVVGEVDQDLHTGVRVQLHLALAQRRVRLRHVEHEAGLLDAGGDALAGQRDQLTDAHRAQVDAGLVAAHARELEHVGDQPRQALALVVDEAIVVDTARLADPALAQHLAVHADRGQRCLQLMTDGGDEGLLLADQRDLPGTEPVQQPGAIAASSTGSSSRSRRLVMARNPCAFAPPPS